MHLKNNKLWAKISISLENTLETFFDGDVGD